MFSPKTDSHLGGLGLLYTSAVWELPMPLKKGKGKSLPLGTVLWWAWSRCKRPCPASWVPRRWAVGHRSQQCAGFSQFWAKSGLTFFFACLAVPPTLLPVSVSSMATSQWNPSPGAMDGSVPLTQTPARTDTVALASSPTPFCSHYWLWLCIWLGCTEM